MRQRLLTLMAVGAVLVSACGESGGSTAAALPTAVIAPHPTSAPIVVAARMPTPPRAAQARALELPTQAPTAAPSPASPAETGVPSAAAPTPARDPALLEALLVAEINRVRAANGLPAYQHSPELSAAARAHSCDLAAHRIISHTSSDGRTLPDRLAGASPAWEWPSESIAAGLDEPAAVVAMWMDEPPEGWHRRNILDADQREVGAGYCFAADDPSGNHHYWTADFSRRASAQ